MTLGAQDLGECSEDVSQNVGPPLLAPGMVVLVQSEGREPEVYIQG